MYFIDLVDAYLMYAASAIAANTVCRSAVGSTAPLFTNYMFDALGVGGGGSLIGGVAALLAIIPFAFYKYGERIRIKSRFAPTGLKPEPPSDEEKATSRQEEFMRPESRASSSSSSSAAASFSSSTLATDRERNTGPEKERRKDEDVPQNELGEPRDENVAFGKESKG